MQPIDTLDLPLSSLLHYLDVHGQTTGPAGDDYIFRNHRKPIYVNHVFEPTSHLGAPRRIAYDAKTLQGIYHNHNRRMLLLRNIMSAERARDSLVVLNYAMIGKTTRYPRSFYTEYYHWYNDFATMLDQIAVVSQTSQRHHFVQVKAPKLLPSVMQLQASEKVFNQQSLKVLKNEDSFLLLEMWKWMGENPESSVFSRLPLNLIHKVNLIYTEASAYTVVNLGQLYAFKEPIDNSGKILKQAKVGSGQGTEQEIAEVTQDNIATSTPLLTSKLTLKPIQIQKRILRMMMTIMETRTLGESKVETVKTTVQSKLASSITDDEDAPTEEIIDDNDISSSSSVAANTVIENDSDEQEQVDELSESDEEVGVSEAEKIAKEDLKLDEDLASLNEIAIRQETESQEQELDLSEIMKQEADPDLSEGIVKLTERLADDGALSAAEYKRLIKLSTAYKDISAPDGSKTPLFEYAKVTPELLKIQNNITIPDSKTVIDKSMLKSSLLDFDRRYVKDILPRDIAAMALSFQSGGIAITSYDVNVLSDAMGSYQHIKIGITPVVGKSSTIEAKIPTVEEDGTFKCNGTLYRMRKKRGD